MRAFPALAVSVFVLACGAPREAPVSGTEGGAGVGDLAVSMEVEVRPDRVHLLLHVTNGGREPVSFTFPTSQRYDFAVTAQAGEQVWQWSSDMAFLQAISHDTLSPGDTWDMDAEWDPGDHAGAFQARGWLTAEDSRLEQQTGFELP